MQFKTLAFLSILSILFFSACSSDGEEKLQKEKELIKEKITYYKVNTIENGEITIDFKDDKVLVLEHPNKIILLNFFATWCPPCKAEIPNLIELQKKYKNDFQIISVLLEKDKTNEEIKNFSKEYGVNYITINDSEVYDIAKALGGIRSIPTMFMLDKNGGIFQKYVGVVPNEMMEIDIKKVLQK